MERQIGVSIISFFPIFLFPGGYMKICRILNGMGIQLLPLRGLRQKHVLAFNVLSFEGPWNCGSVWSALQHHVGISGDNPSFIDIGLFGSEKVCRKRIRMIADCCPNAVAIDTPWVMGGAVELAPNMWKGSARQWTNNKPNGVVLDTYHWRCFNEREALKNLESLGGFSCVRMVHLKLMSMHDTESFLQKKGDENATLLKNFFAHIRGKIPVIIEAKNSALGRSSKLEILTRLEARIRNILEK